MQKQLSTDPIMEFIVNYRCNWRNQFLRILRSRFPFQIVCYKPKWRSLGRPFKSCHETLTGQWANDVESCCCCCCWWWWL